MDYYLYVLNQCHIINLTLDQTYGTGVPYKQTAETRMAIFKVKLLPKVGNKSGIVHKYYIS